MAESEGAEVPLGLRSPFERSVYHGALEKALDAPGVQDRMGVRPGVTRPVVRHIMTTDPARIGRALRHHSRFLAAARRTEAVALRRHRSVVLLRLWARRERARGPAPSRWWRLGTRRLRWLVLCAVLMAVTLPGRSSGGVAVLITMLALGPLGLWLTDRSTRERIADPLAQGLVGAFLLAVVCRLARPLPGIVPFSLTVAVLTLGFATAQHPASRDGFVRLRDAAGGLLAMAPLLLFRELQLRLWQRQFRDADLTADVHSVIASLLGADPDSVWMPLDPAGLRQGHAAELVVPVDSMKRLKAKLGQLQGGTVAVSGPRGAGKSTLLGGTARPDDFSVLVQAPAGYVAHDFLLMLFTTVCERYLVWRGQEVPRYDDLSRFRRMLRNAAGGRRRGAGRAGLLLLSGALLVLGAAPGVRALRDWNGGVLVHAADGVAGLFGAASAHAWAGSTPAPTFLALLLAALLFLFSRVAWLGPGLRSLWNAACVVAGAVLLTWCLVDLLHDDTIRRFGTQFMASGPKDPQGRPTNRPFLLLVVSFAPLFIAARWYDKCRTADPEDGVDPRGWTAIVITVVSGAAGIVLPLALLWHDRHTRPMLLDPDNLPRSALAVLGLALLRLRVPVSARVAAPDLVQDCRAQLLRLQTVQTMSTTLTGAVAPVASLSGSHAAAVTSVPPRFPKLVNDFRELLARIALDAHGRGKRVVISVDELDRLGTDTRALEFLGEIKAVLGIPHVHFLLSVAEDVGAAFVRRGLPHRDATDSSLDDVLHVQPCTLEASRAILDRRADGIPEPYVLLAHALSGGIPRDLIRYARRIVEMQQHTKSHELATVCRRLVVEELADTLAGFRILLGKEEWTAPSSDVLTRFRGLTTLLRTTASATPAHQEALTEALRNFAFRPLPPTPGVPESAVRLVDEATAYAYLALTFLDVFTAPAFRERRAAAAATGPDGDPHLLAEARQELAVSPHSARTLLDAVRRAWGLQVPAGTPLRAVVPAPGGAP
ncbi:P-loop NTPase fold protein [Streptomyces sp. NPDC088785]|uniref:P-loop NTPase fold protein n=1 Tax=Streptomyces sp. NPDC088785 TaxID=3365897 RepID=UPI00380AF381